MSDHTTDERNNSFDDYFKTDNFDDSELQGRLYAKIYYESNIEGESGTTDVPRTVQSNSMATEMSIESESMQHKPEDEQPSAFEAAGDFQRMHSTDQMEFAQVDTLANREMNPVAHECDVNVNPEDLPEVRGKGSKESSSKKHKFFKHAKSKHQESSEKDYNASLNDEAYSKYNVVSKSMKQKRYLAEQASKDKHASDSSDSEESIFEVPVPPKPTPPLINLQDSDEEGDTNVGMDNDPILKKWGDSMLIKTYSRINSSWNPELEFTKTSNTRQDTSSKSRNTNRSSSNKDTPVNSDKNIQISTHAQDFTEDIVLNCTTIQRGARNISEIKQLSKSAGTDQGSKSTEDTNQNFKRRSPQSKTKGYNENVNLQQEKSVISPRKKLQTRTQQNVDKNNAKYNIHNSIHINHEILEMENRKRQHNNEVDSHSKQKRQCTDQQSNQDIMPQGSRSEERRNESLIDFFISMPEDTRNYYNNLTRGQENFDVRELQRGMSKDPRKWAILDEDLMPCPSSRQRTRFWNVRCSNCHRDGHQRYDCPTPRCFMCGTKGHTEHRCPQKMCLTCGKQQSTFRKTCEYCRVLYCTMCNSVGHERKQCPDLWRRYHQTTDMSNTPRNPGVNIIKPPNQLHCCNCTKRGHESSTCREYQWTQHFSTPAVVTNYIDGPAYMPCASSSSGPDPELGFLSPKATRNKISFSQSANNMHQATSEDLEPSTNIDMLSSNTSQGAACTSRMEENLQFSPMADNIWPLEQTDLRKYITVPNDVPFGTIICSYGTFRNKNNKDARMILKNLTLFFQNRKHMLRTILSHEITPIFLKTLLDKTIEFEMKIGYVGNQTTTVTLQLLAMKEYIFYLYNLLKYWLNLPDDEKSYGMDVTLPMNPTKMFNLLNSRAPQLEKMRFTNYAEHIGGLNDPRWIHNFIRNEKANLKKHKGTTKEYNRLRTKLWRLQIKLLMIVNTEPKPNAIVRAFWNVMKKFETERSQMGDKFNIATYLRLTLLYNILFVPHTPDRLSSTLRRVNKEVKKNNKNNCSLQTRQEPEIATCEQGNLVYNVYSSSEPAPSSTPQNINPENPSAINNQQSNEILVEGQNRNDIVPETSETTDRNYDNSNDNEIITIRDSPTHDSRVVTLLNTKPMSVQSEDPRRDKDQLSISEMNAESNLPANKQNVNVNNTLIVNLSKKEKRTLKRLNIDSNNITTTNINDIALNLIHHTRSFSLPHMMNVADEMQRHVHNQTIRPKHIQTLAKLIHLQKDYKKNVNKFCKAMKT